MSNRKNYNSLVFLTTLSVYLGLVLVGGSTPSVLAQAATTRDFNIKNEIVVEDDLDKKPDDDLFIESVVNLVEELDSLSKNKTFDWNTKNSFQIEGFGFCESDNSPSFLGSGSINRKVDKVLEKSAINIARKLYNRKANLGFGDIYSQDSDYDFIFDKGNFEIKIKIGSSNPIASEREKDVSLFYNQLHDYLDRKISEQNAARPNLVAKNTQITFENNQVFIVTRLPRASIDALLSENSAQ